MSCAVAASVTRTICKASGEWYDVATGHGNEYYALSVSSLFTVSSRGLELLKQFRPKEAYGPSVSLAGQLVVSTTSGLQSVHKDGSMIRFGEAESALLVSKNQALLTCFADEGGIIINRGFLGKKNCIYKLNLEGRPPAKLHVLEEGDCVSSLAYDPHTRRVLFTSIKSHALHAIDSSSHVSIVVGSKDEEGSQQGTCPAAEARFKVPCVAVDGDGNCVISDAAAHTVYLFRPAPGTECPGRKW